MKINSFGIGKEVDEAVLHEIAGKNGKVIMVDDDLPDELEKIKDAACGMQSCDFLFSR